MIILMAALGVLVGWLVNWASEYLPHFSENQPASFVPQRLPPTPAFWQLMRGLAKPAWFGLHLGIELLSAAVFAIAALAFGVSGTLALILAGYSFFLLIAVIDLKYRLILNVLTYPAAVLIVAAHLLVGQNTVNIILGGVLAFGLFFLTAWLKPGDLGGGDVKLATVIGFLFGFPQLLWALIVGVSLGALISIALLVTKRGGWQTRIPYAPFLCLGAMVALLYNPIVLRG